MQLPKADPPHRAVALLAEGVDRNLKLLRTVKRRSSSPSSRRAWIEILIMWRRAATPSVALLAEGVDRNLLSQKWTESTVVALLAEGVDRNRENSRLNLSSQVALLAEGVDRNPARGS